MSSEKHNQPNMGSSDFKGLPYEPESSSELLYSTHIFTVEILSLDATPFAVGDDGLEHRRLTTEIRLLEIFKGTLDVSLNQTFRCEVEQRRESEFFVTDYHGLWSHLEPDIGIRYIVIASAALTSPAALLQEGPLQNLLDMAYDQDVRLGLEAERHYQEALAKGKEGALPGAVSDLLSLARDRRAVSKDVFGRYLWARVGTIFLHAPDSLLPNILGIILSEDATVELRRSLVADLNAAVLLLDPNSEVFRTVIRAYFTLLSQPSASPLHPNLIEVDLYNLIFQAEQPRFSVPSIFPDPADRSALKAILARFDSSRAQSLLVWLES